jgi:hypothetical protein
MDGADLAQWYPLRIVVSIWTAMYQASLRFDRWSRDPALSLEAALYDDVWSHDLSPAGGIMRSAQKRYEKLQDGNCKKTIRALEAAWKTRLDQQSTQTSEKRYPFKSRDVDLVSLFAARSFSGSVWNYDALICHVPEHSRVMAFKINSSDFGRMADFFKNKVELGRSPFVGMKTRVSRCEVHWGFNRIRRRSSTRVLEQATQWLPTFKELISACRASTLQPKEFHLEVAGSSPLCLKDYFVSRFLNSLVFFRPFITTAIIESSDDRGSEYIFGISIDKSTIAGGIENSFCFDSSLNLEKLAGQEATVFGFIPIGLQEPILRRIPITLLALCPATAEEIKQSKNLSQTQEMPSIAEVTKELADAFLFKSVSPKFFKELKKEMKLREPKLEVKAVPTVTVQMPVAEPELPPLQLKPPPPPYYTEMSEAEFSPLEGSILRIMSLERDRIHQIGDLMSRLRHEGLSESLDNVKNALGYLMEKDIVYGDIFGEGWLLNPRIKILPKDAAIPLTSVKEEVLNFLASRYPEKMPISKIAQRILFIDGRISRKAIGDALKSLWKEKEITIHKKNRWSFNPYHPRKDKKTPRETWKLHEELDETTIARVPDVCRAHQTGYVHIYVGNQHKKFWVGSFKDSPKIVAGLINKVRAGRISSIEFTDQLNGNVKIWRTEDGTVKGAYKNPRRSAFTIIMGMLKTKPRKNKKIKTYVKKTWA